MVCKRLATLFKPQWVKHIWGCVQSACFLTHDPKITFVLSMISPHPSAPITFLRGHPYWPFSFRRWPMSTVRSIENAAKWPQRMTLQKSYMYVIAYFPASMCIWISRIFRRKMNWILTFLLIAAIVTKTSRNNNSQLEAHPERRPPLRLIWGVWNSFTRREIVYPKTFQNVACSIPDLLWKYQEHSFPRFFL